MEVRAPVWMAVRTLLLRPCAALHGVLWVLILEEDEGCLCPCSAGGSWAL